MKMHCACPTVLTIYLGGRWGRGQLTLYVCLMLQDYLSEQTLPWAWWGPCLAINKSILCIIWLSSLLWVPPMAGKLKGRGTGSRNRVPNFTCMHPYPELPWTTVGHPTIMIPIPLANISTGQKVLPYVEQKFVPINSTHWSCFYFLEPENRNTIPLLYDITSDI